MIILSIKEGLQLTEKTIKTQAKNFIEQACKNAHIQVNLNPNDEKHVPVSNSFS